MALINILWLALACLGSYFLGSIPFSVWIGKMVTNVDLRDENIQNPGGMNAVMTYGFGIGLLIMLLDFSKGTILITLIDKLFSLEYFVAPDGSNIWYTLAVILGPMFGIAGHNYSIWLKFKGGQGLGVFMGVLLYLNPILFTFYAIGIIFIAMVVKMNIRYGTMLIIILDTIFALFLPISPPWIMLPLNEFSWAPNFLHVKLAIVFLAMFVMLFIRALQALIQKKTTSTWRVGPDGHQQFDN